MTQQPAKTFGESFRVLDLTDEQGYFCGKILAEFGADVVKVEEPVGDRGRRIGPFYHDIPDPEKSLFWFAYNINKRGITLNIRTADGREIFRRLLETADCVIESFPPGHLDELGLGYAAISQMNPRIIVTSITPFGQTGPYKDYKTSDIVGMATGGFVYITGDPGRPPVRVSSPQAYLHAGADAAVGTLMAYYYRETAGQGQHVDVSIQASVTPSVHQAAPNWNLNRVIIRRNGVYRSAITSGGSKSRAIWPCRDGYVAFVVHGAALGARTNKALAEWMDADGMADDLIRELGSEEFDMAKATPQVMDQIDERIGRFFMAHTKAELYGAAIQREIMLQPVNTVKDLLEDRQLKARDFWSEVRHDELGASIVYPGPAVKGSLDPCRLRHRAPLIGEHNLEIYQTELGLSREQLCVLKQANVI